MLAKALPTSRISNDLLDGKGIADNARDLSRGDLSADFRSLTLDF